MYYIDYQYSDSIVCIQLIGKVTLAEIEQLARDLYQAMSQGVKLLLTDARDAEYEFSASNINEVIRITNPYYLPNATIYEAILIDSPREMAITHLYDKQKKRPNHVYKIFTTQNAALNWLMTRKIEF